MKCPACKNTLREQVAGDMTVDVCDNCGGIWFDASELERVSARGDTTLQAFGHVPTGNVKLTETRICPRCDPQILARKWFSELKEVEIDECSICNGIWLDAGEFDRIYDESKRAKVSSPLWLAALEFIAAREGKASPAIKHTNV